ncbi:16863_t:CDS:2 [Funneliformis mosseae]|uniref:16863_t:CDS:1 n=1 Tax=Funneliformis mosseae TaxID=27381 RepID=A0A9N8V6W2_FUNMO|nr:16863_t:CDS:2 [Funneliformis mosseae]
MATNTTSHHLTPHPTSSRQRNPPSPRTQSKSILSIALQKAQAAVQFDAANNVAAALDAYKQTVELLFQVIDKAVNEPDRRRADSIGQKSVSENDSQTDGNEITSSSSMIRDINGKSVEIDNSHNNETHLVNETILTNGVDHHNRNDTVDYITPQPKRLSLLSHRSNTSVSTSRSWISMKSFVSDKTTPASIYEVTVDVDGAKPVADSSDNGESTSRSSDLDSSSEDIDSAINDYLQNSDSYGASSEIMEENSSYQNQGSSSSQRQEKTGMEKENSQANSLSRSSSLRLSIGNRLFVPPPPPKIAPPTTPPSPSDQFRQNEASVFSPPDKSALMGRRSTSPTIVPPPSVVKQPNAPSSASLHETVNESMLGSSSQTMSDEDDDKVSVKSVPNSFTRPSSSSMEKLLSKALPQGRRPAPLPLAPQNSRIVPTRTPSNPNLVATPNNSVLPRRAASNPGNTPKKTGSVRFFNSNSQSSSNPLAPIPGTPSSPWMNSFSIISPPLGSPGFGPPSGMFRSETPSSSSSKHNDASYSGCLSNPLPNTFFYDDPHMSSNNRLFEPSPNDLHLNPFWLMKLLERTMTTGGYLTPKLFIPRNLWLQGHVKLAAIDTKISSCEVVSTCLMKLTKTTFNDMDNLAKGLQNSLARKLNYIESTNGKGRQSTSSLMNWGSKLSRGLDRMGMGNAMVRTEEASGYVEVLLKVFQQAGVVENYIRHFSSLNAPYHQHHKQIVARLHKFADFFGNVICRFVVKDLGVLTDKYVKKASLWITE